MSLWRISRKNRRLKLTFEINNIVRSGFIIFIRRVMINVVYFSGTLTHCEWKLLLGLNPSSSLPFVKMIVAAATARDKVQVVL